MKADLATSIITAIAGVVIAFIVCNLLLAPIQDVTFNVLSTSGSYSTLTEPNPEVFNYRSLNPTVEVYVGNCAQYDAGGNCIDDITKIEAEEESQNPDESEQ